MDADDTRAPLDDGVREVEARIAWALSRLATDDTVGGRRLPPAAYLRRHLVEHAQAGGVLNDAVIPDALLPYLDLARYREFPLRGLSARLEATLTLDAALRTIKTWDWEHPEQNAVALELNALLKGMRRPRPNMALDGWQVLWTTVDAQLDTGESDVTFSPKVAAAALPDGRTVVVVAGFGDERSVNDVVQVWDLASGSLLHELPCHTTVVNTLVTAALADGRAVAIISGSDGHDEKNPGTTQLSVWDLTDGSLLRWLPTGESKAWILVASAVLPDGRAVAVAAGFRTNHGGTLRVWDLADGSVLHELADPAISVSALRTTVLPDGRAVAVIAGTDEDQQPRYVGKRAKPSADDDEWNYWTAEDDEWFIFDGQVVRVWDLADGTLVSEFPGVGGEWFGADMTTSILPGGRAVAALVGDGRVMVRDVSDGTMLHTHRGQPHEVSAVTSTVLPDGRCALLVGFGFSYQHVTVKAWDLVDGTPLHELPDIGNKVTDLAATVLPDGRKMLIASGRSGPTRVWDLADDAVVRTLPGVLPGVYAVATAIRPDGDTVVVSGDGQGVVSVRALTDGALHYQVNARGYISGIATLVLADGRAVAVVGNEDEGPASVWDLADGSLIQELSVSGKNSSVGTALLPDGRGVAIIGGWDDEGDAVARVWDVVTGTLIHELAGHARHVSAVATSILPDGRAVAVVGGADSLRHGALKVWDLSDGSLLHDLDDAYVHRIATAVQADGRVVAIVGGYCSAKVWNLADGTHIGELPECDGEADVASAILRDGRVVVLVEGRLREETSWVGGYHLGDSITRLWDLETMQCIGELPDKLHVSARSIAHGGEERPVIVIATGTAVAALKFPQLPSSSAGTAHLPGSLSSSVG